MNLDDLVLLRGWINHIEWPQLDSQLAEVGESSRKRIKDLRRQLAVKARFYGKPGEAEIESGTLAGRRALVRGHAADDADVVARGAVALERLRRSGFRASFPVATVRDRARRRQLRGNRMDGPCDTAVAGPATAVHRWLVARAGVGAVAHVGRLPPELQHDRHRLVVGVRHLLRRHSDRLPLADDVGLCEHAEPVAGGADARQLHGLAARSVPLHIVQARPGLANRLCDQSLGRGSRGHCRFVHRGSRLAMRPPFTVVEL